MINIPAELREIYLNDIFPIANEVTPKNLIIYFPTLDLTIETDQIVDDKFSLVESLCSESDLVFGSCVAAKIKLTVADVVDDLTGQWFTINQVIEGFDPVPLGVYKVDSCIKQDNLRFKDITAYNIFKDTDKDVSEWYNSLFPTGNETYTLKQFRESLLAYLGIEFESEALPNDSMIVEKTVDAGQLSAREVLRCCVELQGAFGQINRHGRFYHKILEPAYGLYPTEDLYPAEDLYPVAEDDISYINDTLIDETIPRHQEVRFEEYTVKEIDKLIIRSEEDDIGAIVGTGSNAYIIQGNFLVFGKTAGELEQIARNAYGNMAKRPYRPYEAKCIGLPYIEPGDTVQINNYGDPVVGYVLQRTLTGIQALMDELKAEGAEQREQNFGVNNEIIQLKGRTTRIKKDIEGVRVEVENLEKRTNTRFEQTDQAISAEATRAINAETELSGRLDVMAGKVVLKVDANGNVAAVELDADPSQGTNIKIKADNIQLEGLVTANGNFKVLPDGSIEAVNGKFSGVINGSTITGTNISGATINGGTITGVTISGSSITTIGDYGTVSITNGFIDASYIYANTIDSKTLTVDTISMSGGGRQVFITPSGITGIIWDTGASYSFLTSLNYSNYISIPQYTNQITAVDTGYGNLDFKGFDNAAGVNWVQANFQPKTPSDVRLKYDMKPLDLPDELFYSLKPYQFRFKPETNYGDEIRFGLIAQQVESAFEEHGLNPYDYDLIEVVDVRKYTDDGYYVNDTTHRLNDKNFIAWIIDILKKQKTEIENLKTLLKLLEKR